jgi:hypothetical protein
MNRRAIVSLLLLPLVSGGMALGRPARAGQLPGRDGQSRGQQVERGQNLKVLGLSFLLPGLAHWSMGQRTRGTAFLAAEAGLWGAFAGFRVQGSIRRDSYVEMARLHAAVERPEGRGEEYYRRISSWPSSDRFNELIRQDARTLYGDDLAGRAAYEQANRVPSDEAWNWESHAAQDRYRQKRSDSRVAFRRARNMLGLAVVNRAVAMVDAALTAHPKNKAGALRLQMLPGGEPASAELRFSYALP